MTDASETIGIAPERRDELLNKRELAARLKLGFRTLERWQRRGVLPYVKVGNVVRFHWSSVVASLLEYYQAWDKGGAKGTEKPRMARMNADGATTKQTGRPGREALNGYSVDATERTKGTNRIERK